MVEDKVEAALEIRAAQIHVNEARKELEACVIAARRAGLTWTEIGKSLGMSRQAAWEKFKKLED